MDFITYHSGLIQMYWKCKLGLQVFQNELQTLDIKSQLVAETNHMCCFQFMHYFILGLGLAFPGNPNSSTCAPVLGVGHSTEQMKLYSTKVRLSVSEGDAVLLEYQISNPDLAGKECSF